MENVKNMPNFLIFCWNIIPQLKTVICILKQVLKLISIWNVKIGISSRRMKLLEKWGGGKHHSRSFINHPLLKIAKFISPPPQEKNIFQKSWSFFRIRLTLSYDIRIPVYYNRIILESLKTRYEGALPSIHHTNHPLPRLEEHILNNAFSTL